MIKQIRRMVFMVVCAILIFEVDVCLKPSMNIQAANNSVSKKGSIKSI